MELTYEHSLLKPQFLNHVFSHSDLVIWNSWQTLIVKKLYGFLTLISRVRVKFLKWLIWTICVRELVLKEFFKKKQTLLVGDSQKFDFLVKDGNLFFKITFFIRIVNLAKKLIFHWLWVWVGSCQLCRFTLFGWDIIFRLILKGFLLLMRALSLRASAKWFEAGTKRFFLVDILALRSIRVFLTKASNSTGLRLAKV